MGLFTENDLNLGPSWAIFRDKDVDPRAKRKTLIFFATFFALAAILYYSLVWSVLLFGGNAKKDDAAPVEYKSVSAEHSRFDTVKNWFSSTPQVVTPAVATAPVVSPVAVAAPVAVVAPAAVAAPTVVAPVVAVVAPVVTPAPAPVAVVAPVAITPTNPAVAAPVAVVAPNPAAAPAPVVAPVVAPVAVAPSIKPETKHKAVTQNTHDLDALTNKLDVMLKH